MENSQGFIVISRSISEWKYWDSEVAVALWLHILIRANWKTGYFQGHEIPRGSFATSIVNFAAECNVHPNTVRKWLKRFEDDNQITVISTNKFSVINVINYAKYQCQHDDRVKQDVEQDVKQDVKQSVKQRVEQRVDNRTKKQRNKETKEIYMTKFEDFWAEYPKKEGKQTALKSFTKVCTSEEIFNEIMEGLKRFNEIKYNAMLAAGDKQFIPNASTWLNQKRWEEAKDLTPERRSGKRETVLPEYYNASPVREESQNTATQDEVNDAMERLRSMFNK